MESDLEEKRSRPKRRAEDPLTPPPEAIERLKAQKAIIY